MAELRLNLNLFTKVRDDVEKRQYIILAELKKISTEFQYYKIYPHLSRLVDIRNTLQDVIDRLADLRNKFPKRISKIDWVNRTIEHEVVFVARQCYPGSPESRAYIRQDRGLRSG